MYPPPNHRYCSLCDLWIHESSWSAHSKLHENRGEVVNGKATKEALEKALHRNNSQLGKEMYRAEVMRVQ
jgi:hypothetical protein